MISETIATVQESREKGAAVKKQASDAAPTSEAAADIKVIGIRFGPSIINGRVQMTLAGKRYPWIFDLIHG